MKLTVMERLMCLGILPEAGNFVTMRMRQELILKLGLTTEEITEYDVKQLEGGSVQWRQDLPQEKEIDVKPTEIVEIKKNLEKMDKDEKLTPQHISLYEKFVEGG